MPLEDAVRRQEEILQDSRDFEREAAALGLDPKDPPQEVPDPPQSPRRVFLEEEEEVLVSDEPSAQDFGDYAEGECANCVDDSLADMNKYAMPIFKYKEKRYYLGIFFKANWFRANQYCRYHGMHLASISSQEENDKLEETIRDFGYSFEHFWVSGTDLAEEGQFFWMSTGRPITFTNWNAGEPNNFRYENGEEENCLELWDRDGKGLKWNDSACSFETYFVCEAVP